MADIKSINPADAQVLKVFQEMSQTEIENIICKADKAFAEWKKTTFAQRSELLKKVAAIMLERKREISELCAKEMGKIIPYGDGETDVCIMILNYYADNGEKFLADKPIETPNGKAFITYQPLGVILSVQPWNAPFYQMIRSAAPNIMAGNTIIMKQASNVPQCAKLMEDIFREAGSPEGVYTNLFLSGSKISPLLNDRRITGATLTGSVKAGESFASAAAANVIPSILELGGNDPFIVLPDADIDKAIQTATSGRIWNAGQICCSPKRIIVPEEMYDTFVSKSKQIFESVKIGDPLDKDTELGPVCTMEALEKVEKQVQTAIAQGAKVQTGGKRIDREGYFMQPTVLTDITKEMDIYNEEVFGPVLMIYKVKSTDEAIELANDTTYGLGGTVFGNNEEEAVKVARQINTGMVYINHVTVSVGPEIPFGGTKKSGYGRELSKEAIYEFTNHKLIRITTPDSLY